MTSSYYYAEYPQWVVDWNAKKLPESYANTAWELLHPIDTYLFGDHDDQEWEFALDSFGRTFPHKFTTPENPYLSTFLTISPAGDEMTTDFAKTLIAKEGLGDDEITDYLGVSYIVPRWNCIATIYQPKKGILDESWIFPDPQAAD